MQGHMIRDPIDCAWCGVTFTPHRYNQVYCSVDHQVKAYRKRTYRNFETSIKQCAYCGKDFSQFREYHKCCCEDCANRWYKQRTRKEPMPMKERSDMKMRNQLENWIPQEFIDVMDAVIAHKLTLPGDLITTRRVLALARKRHPIKLINTQVAACHYHICEQLEKAGGVLSKDFENCVGGSHSRYDYRSRSVYRMR